MATLALAAAGAALGGAVLPAGLTVLGATISGPALGSQVGALAGRYIDQALFGPSGQTRVLEGPRLRDLHVTTSSEGAPIPRVYGSVRIGGQVIWATDFEEEVVTSASGGSGKGAPSAAPGTQTIEYRYYANFAVGLAEGEIGGLGRVWADGKELDLSQFTYRLYTGSESQQPDSLIAARAASGPVPAFRGTAYVVFERMPLANFGNRIPQLSFEVLRPVEKFAREMRGVVLIPGSGEFALSPQPVSRIVAAGDTSAENVHTRQGGTDWKVALDQLQATLPNAGSVSLVVSWFGTDLRAGNCELRPGVESRTKATLLTDWSVAGLARSSGYQVSEKDGRAAYGGTPSDKSVIGAIADLKARGLSVTINPFILMDVASDNSLPNPYGGDAQPAYPWRGRITVFPAAGQPGSADKTSFAASQIAAFVGTARPEHFSVFDGAVSYTGPAEWSYRRMVLHQAALAKAAGGVDAFMIGSELRGLTTARDSASNYPFVTALIRLAEDVKTLLPDTKVLYSADWSEYFGHQPADGSGDVYFHLDPLWASPSIDAIGLDIYWPLADWRDGNGHLDAIGGTRSIYDIDYLRANVAGGEGFDWYYASAADREVQNRTSITDGQGKPWVFRYKDLRSWWLNHHFNRPGGIESNTSTAWIPQSKPFWVMEIGCPAVDRGANQPNVFVDAKSSESALPYYSRGTRDDLMQRRYLQAFLGAFDPNSPFALPDLNPSSSLYAGRMVDLDRIHVYCWDARPYPAFPLNTQSWGDAANWRLGHWITGRIAGGALADTIAQILNDYGFADHDSAGLQGIVSGYVIDRVMSAREALQPLELAYFVDSLETEGRIVFRQRGVEPPAVTLGLDDLVESKPGAALLTMTRGQETDLPASLKLSYLSAVNDYAQAVSEARRLGGASGRLASAQVPVVMAPEAAASVAEQWLFEAWSSREKAAFAVPPSLIALEPGDAVFLADATGGTLVRITETGDHGSRDIEALSLDPTVYGGSPAPQRAGRVPESSDVGQPVVEILDLPRLTDSEPGPGCWVAARQVPWPGSVALLMSPEQAGYRVRAVPTAPAIIGTLLDPILATVHSRFDYATRVRVSIGSAQLSSVSLLQLFAGANAAAIRYGDGDWELVQFRDARLILPGVYELSGFLRGQAGSEHAMAALPSGATFVLLDQTVTRLVLSAAEVGPPFFVRYGPGNRDIGDASYATRSFTFKAVNQRPLAPCHVRATRTSDGIVISWIRRTREGGDSWDVVEVPLGEDSERYEVDVVGADSQVKRTLSVTTQQAVYAQADQVADFGEPAASGSIRVYQMSSTWGRGYPATVAI